MTLCIYHGNCADGFTAAWSVWKALPDAEFHAGVYQSPPPDVRGRDVVLVDFCYPRETLKEMARSARSILVLDHHQTARDALAPSEPGKEEPPVIRLDLPPWIGEMNWHRHMHNVVVAESQGAPYAEVFAYFDMQRSGAMLAWDFFHPDVPAPRLVQHVQDHDLWQFKIPGTREFQAAVFSYPYSFEVWDLLARTDPDLLIAEGRGIERKHHKDIAELVKVTKRRMAIGGFDVPVASLPYTLSSDASHLMAQSEPFAACYWDTPDGRVFSLRSSESGQDVSAIAKQYGGGGHRNASGFKVPHDHVLASAQQGQAEADRNRLREALARLVGASEPAELIGMEAALHMMRAPDEDKAALINAIHSLLAVPSNAQVEGTERSAAK